MYIHIQKIAAEYILKYKFEVLKIYIPTVKGFLTRAG